MGPSRETDVDRTWSWRISPRQDQLCAAGEHQIHLHTEDKEGPNGHLGKQMDLRFYSSSQADGFLSERPPLRGGGWLADPCLPRSPVIWSHCSGPLIIHQKALKSQKCPWLAFCIKPFLSLVYIFGNFHLLVLATWILTSNTKAHCKWCKERGAHPVVSWFLWSKSSRFSIRLHHRSGTADDSIRQAQ